MGGRRGAIALATLLPFIAPLYAPQLLAFPYRTPTPVGTVWSVQPVPPALLAKASATVRTRMAATPLADANERRPIFLTDGGWRWTWLAPGSSGAFALSRPLTKAVIVNTVDYANGTIHTRRAIGNQRGLGAVLAHEFCHGLIRRRFGVLPAEAFPAWKVEGYCDHVAGESSLTAADAAKLEASGEHHPALIYFRGRERVEAELARNGGDVTALFERNSDRSQSSGAMP